MSDIGLFAGIYQQARGQAELLDLVLVRLNAGTSRPGDEDRRHLAAWLTSLDPWRTDDYGALFARSLLGKHGASFQQGWGELGEALQQDPVAPSIVARLEDLARMLVAWYRANLMSRDTSASMISHHSRP
jgi:hypothetical protein